MSRNCTKVRTARAARFFLIQPIRSSFSRRLCRCRRPGLKMPIVMRQTWLKVQLAGFDTFRFRHPV